MSADPLIDDDQAQFGSVQARRLQLGAGVLGAAIAAGGMLVARLAGGGPAALAGSPWLAVLVYALIAAALGAWMAGRWARSVLAPLAEVHRTVRRLSAGDLDARSGSDRAVDRDEVQDPGPEELRAAFDAFLDERLAPMARAVRDNEGLNNSVIEIMQAVGTIATTKDLALRVPVTEDVTGAISDALNLLTEETARVLGNVTAVSRQVAHASLAVKGQGELATQAAVREQREVELAARELSQAAAALAAIAERARNCNAAAERAVAKTGDAVRSVGGTVAGIAESRELIRETEKRVKRLGERTHEISMFVGTIQSIAERTGILALNASMHAAAAGEAGRSFAVVADEVKRLSESVRDAAGRIARLVTAIKAESNDTVIAVNQAITRVVEISRMADDATQDMRLTQSETEALAASVRDIARTSTEQAKVGAGLQERARIIQEASSETSLQLAAQGAETRRLVDCARALLDEVSVFKLPREG